jgi:hypothetical protein
LQEELRHPSRKIDGMSKAPLKPRVSLTPAEMVRVATEVAPELPPATAAGVPDAPGILTVRLMESTMVSVAREAKARGMTQRQLVAQALQAFGLKVSEIDLKERTAPRRRA